MAVEKLFQHRLQLSSHVQMPILPIQSGIQRNTTVVKRSVRCQLWKLGPETGADDEVHKRNEFRPNQVHLMPFCIQYLQVKDSIQIVLIANPDNRVQQMVHSWNFGHDADENETGKRVEQGTLWSHSICAIWELNVNYILNLFLK